MSALERLKCVFQAFFGSGGDCRTAVGSRILLHSSRGQHSVTGLPQVLKIRTSHSKLGEILGFFFQITTRRLVHCRHVTGHSENYLDFWVYLKLSNTKLVLLIQFSEGDVIINSSRLWHAMPTCKGLREPAKCTSKPAAAPGRRLRPRSRSDVSLGCRWCPDRTLPSPTCVMAAPLPCGVTVALGSSDAIP